MKGDQRQNENKERKKESQKERAKEKHGIREMAGGMASECESGVLTVTGALRLHDT